jgi:hypothetical protein
MQRPRRLACVLLACTGYCATPHAQSGGTFAITKSSVDSGAGSSAAAPFAVRYSAGQPDAAYSAGGTFEVRGGFWGSRSNPPTDTIFADAFD